MCIRDRLLEGGLLMQDYRRIPLWKDVTAAEWNDWRWQLKNRLVDLDTLKQVIPLTQMCIRDRGIDSALIKRAHIAIAQVVGHSGHNLWSTAHGRLPSQRIQRACCGV